MKIIFKLTKLCDSFANGIFVHCIFYLDIRILMLFFNDTNTNKRITKHNNYLRNLKPMIYWQFVHIDAIENNKKKTNKQNVNSLLCTLQLTQTQIATKRL